MKLEAGLVNKDLHWQSLSSEEPTRTCIIITVTHCDLTQSCIEGSFFFISFHGAKVILSSMVSPVLAVFPSTNTVD